MSPGEVSRVRQTYETLALHLGTYEAAIESMLRRMRDEGDAGAQFYLHRVSLRRHGPIIEEGWRDENLEEAAQITQDGLRESDVIRYLNVRESPGSISLAVRPEAIDSIQRNSLPDRVIRVTAESSLLGEIASIRAQVERIEITRSEDLDTLARLQQKRASGLGAPFTRSLSQEQYELLERIDQLIADEYLPGVSRPVRASFADALSAWHSAQESAIDDAAYISRFASMARTLTQPDEIRQELKYQPVRKLH
jgi:hypothetical protein